MVSITISIIKCLHYIRHGGYNVNILGKRISLPSGRRAVQRSTCLPEGKSGDGASPGKLGWRLKDPPGPDYQPVNSIYDRRYNAKSAKHQEKQQDEKSILFQNYFYPDIAV